MEHLKETARLETFSDGVFAIAITLLILEIKVPPGDAVHSVNDLWNGLFHLWPSYFAFVYSFGTILIMWLNHHKIFNMVSKSSVRFMYANGFLLLTVTIIPFITALLAEYISTDYRKPAVIIFCFGSVLNNLAFIICTYTLLHPKRLIMSNLDFNKISASLQATKYGLLFYCTSTLVAFWLPVVAILMNCSLWILWIVLSFKDYTPAINKRKLGKTL
jgi:uncharacterized membrane protein